MEETLLLNEEQRDALQELANIGAGHASTVLSQMVNREIRMGVPRVDVVSLEKTIDYVKDEKVVVGVYMKISQELPSYILLLIPRQSAFALVDLLVGDETYEREILSEMDKSALQEVSNVMICAFFDSLSELLGISLIPGPPVLAYDIPVAVMDYVLIQIGEVADKIVVFNVELKEEKKNNFKINMFLLPLPHSVNKLLTKLGVG
ncbi:MAG: chemotaxis protein CheC [Euryarchaeota archaeon]|nr:chemotaxis protein CheC [Euryarchaeota archaeon]